MFPLTPPCSAVRSIRHLVTASPHGETRWVAAEDVADELLGADGFRLAEWQESGRLETVKTGPHRTVYRVTLESGRYYLKHYRVCDWKAMLQNVVRPPQAVLEWNAARNASAVGVPTFDAVAVGRTIVSGLARDSFLASRAIPDAQQLDAFIAGRFIGFTPGRQSVIRQRLARELGRLAATLHRGRLLHRDLHAGNILIRLDDEDAIRLWLIDLHAVSRCRRLTLRRIERGLALLNPFFVRYATAADCARFFRSYWSGLHAPPDARTAPPAGVASSSARPAERRIAAHCRHKLVRVTRRRDAKWSRGNRRLIIADGNNVRCRGLASLGPTLLYAIRDDPESLFGRDAFGKTPGNTIPGISENPWDPAHGDLAPSVRLGFSHDVGGGRRVTLCRLNCGGRTIDCRVEAAEQPRRSRWWEALLDRLLPVRGGRHSAVRRAWEIGHAFLRRGINTARPLAFVEIDSPYPQQTTRQYLLTERISDAVTLDEHLRQASRNLPQPVCKRRLSGMAARLADQLRKIHAAGFDHRSLSAETILVSRDGAREQFWFVSLENVRQRRRVTDRQIAEALGRLYGSLLSHEPIRLTDRLRFLKRYLREQPASGWKTMWRAVQQRSKSPGPIENERRIYRPPKGRDEGARRKSA